MNVETMSGPQLINYTRNFLRTQQVGVTEFSQLSGVSLACVSRIKAGKLTYIQGVTATRLRKFFADWNNSTEVEEITPTYQMPTPQPFSFPEKAPATAHSALDALRELMTRGEKYDELKRAVDAFISAVNEIEIANKSGDK